jgi:hypothetical protein
LVLFGKAKQRGLGTAAFEWEASHSKRALAFPHERLLQEGQKGKGKKQYLMVLRIAIVFFSY